MFGRVRAASSFSSLESLELERPPPKITKEDSLSVYEATLLKLKLGSQRNSSSQPSKDEGGVDAGLVSCSNSLEPMKIDVNSSASASQNCPEFTRSLNKLEEVITMDTDHFLPLTHSNSRASDSVSNKEENIASIFYLFSKFKNAQKAVGNPSDDSLGVENGYAVSFSPSFSTSQSFDTKVQQSEKEFVPSLPV